MNEWITETKVSLTIRNKNINFQDSLPNTDLYELTPMKLLEDLFSNLTEISRTSQSL